MSDINRKVQVATSAEADDLSALAASKDLLSKGPRIEDSLSAPANSADLATASISPADVMRVAHRSETRSNTQTEIGRAAGEAHNVRVSAVTLTNKRSRALPEPRGAPTATGILKNPFYRYDGGLLNKVLALIGNILKVIERILLRLLGARDSSPTHNHTQPMKQKQETSSEGDKEHLIEQKKRKEHREKAELLVKRQ